MTDHQAPAASEEIRYDEPGIPLYVRCGRLSDYPSRWGSCHWHQDLEFIHIVSGEMRHFISGERVLLREGDSMLINAGQIHYCYTQNMQDCTFLCILVPPSLLSPCDAVSERFFRPMVTDFSFPCAVFRSGTEEGEGYKALLRKCWQMKEEAAFGYQVDIIARLSSLAMIAARTHRQRSRARQDKEDQTLIAQKRMVAFIKAHFQENISQRDIAQSAPVSEDGCIRIFKSCLGQTPLQYLNAYRLEASRRLLLNTDQKVSQISEQCGFRHISYYGRLFEKAYGLSPLMYRKKIRTEE